MYSEDHANLKEAVDDLIKDAYNILPEIIVKTKPSDDRAKRSRAKWFERHRLHVLLEAAEETSKKIPKNVVSAPWFLAEFKATIEIIHRWQKNPIWKDLEPSLADKNHFTHTIGKLHIAENLLSSGHRVEIVPRGKDASPDLRIQAIGGTQDWAYIECYQPSMLVGKETAISKPQFEEIINTSMIKAKRQFAKKHPGILAIVCYNQSQKAIAFLKQKIADRLDDTNRPYLAGFLLVHQSILFNKDTNTISFQPIISFEFISNPSYFGRVDFEAYTPKNDPKLIRQHLFDVKTEDLLNNKINGISRETASTSVSDDRIRKTKNITLQTINEPLPNSRAISEKFFGAKESKLDSRA